MGPNEILLIASSLLTAVLILAAWRLDRERLHNLILIFLILISIGGGKLVEFFGFITNTGNIFYAGVFLATYFLIERYGRKEGFRSIWIGVLGVLIFSTFLLITIALVSAQSTQSLSNSFALALDPVPQLAFASIAAYIASQTLNVYLYLYLKDRQRTGSFFSIWLRVNGANIIAQALDSIIFFTIAFWSLSAVAEVWEILLTGFVIKVLFVMLFSPLLALDRTQRDDDGKEFLQLQVW